MLSKVQNFSLVDKLKSELFKFNNWILIEVTLHNISQELHEEAIPINIPVIVDSSGEASLLKFAHVILQIFLR